MAVLLVSFERRDVLLRFRLDRREIRQRKFSVDTLDLREGFLFQFRKGKLHESSLGDQGAIIQKRIIQVLILPQNPLLKVLLIQRLKRERFPLTDMQMSR